MGEPYRLPTATIIAATASGDVATVAIDISQEEYLGYPVAPADLREADLELRDPKSHTRFFEFHQLIGREGTRLVFETYRITQLLPVVGDEYSFCSWWTHWAMDAVRDLSADWQRLKYPNDGSHAHCLLSHETISSYTGEGEGYHSQHGWITVAAYTEYIDRDRFRIRHHWRSCEMRPTHLHRIDE